MNLSSIYWWEGRDRRENALFLIWNICPKIVPPKNPISTFVKHRFALTFSFSVFLTLKQEEGWYEVLSQGLCWTETHKALSEKEEEWAAQWYLYPSLSGPRPYHLREWCWHPMPAAPAFLCLRDFSGLRRPVGHWHGRSEVPAINTSEAAFNQRMV